MGAATVIIFAAVMHRYAAGCAIPGVQDWLLHLDMGWAQELCIIMFVWMAKFGAAYGVRTGIHVGVDVLINRLDDRNRAALHRLRAARRRAVHGHRRHPGRHLRLGERRPLFDLPASWASNTGGMFEGPTTPDLEWPTWIVYCAMPLGSSLMCFRFLQVCVAFIRTGDLPHHDHGHVEGVEEVALPEPGQEDKIYRMDDEVHPHDLKSPHLGDDTQRGDKK